MQLITNIKNWYQNLPEKKKYLEFFSALLTVPMLVTVILLNLNNLNITKKNNAAQTPNPTTVPIVQIVVPSTATSTPTTKLTPTISTTTCKAKVGPIEITSPNDNEVISKDPVNINIEYNKGNYCDVVWSYRLNGGDWSDYSDKSISLYNLSSGDKNLEIKVKSIVSNDEVLLKKKFIYQGPSSTPTITSVPTITPTISTASANFN